MRCSGTSRARLPGRAERVGKFAAAADGTLVLDEINSLPLALQAKLLRAVEERVFERLGCNKSQPFRARIIAISNVPLDQEVAKERFRADLYYRLNVVGFRLRRFGTGGPRCSARRKFLAEHPWRKARDRHFSPEALRPWRRTTGRATSGSCGTSSIGRRPCAWGSSFLADLPRTPRRRPPGAGGVPPPSSRPSPMFATARPPDDEVWRICEALRKHGNVRARAAAELGMSRVSLYKKLHKYGLFDNGPDNDGKSPRCSMGAAAIRRRRYVLARG